MKKVTVNGVDHELSPDSPRATSHSALLQNIVTSVNTLEAGVGAGVVAVTPLALSSTSANVITTATADANTSSSVAALTIKPTVALTSGDLVLDVQQSTGTSLLKVAQTTGNVTALGAVASAGLTNSAALSLTSFTDDSATAGDRTVNKVRGISKIASAGAPTALTITNSFCVGTSTVLAVIQTNDATATIKNVVPGTGSFVINLVAAATADTKISWVVIN
jgi:hypothetical protein